MRRTLLVGLAAISVGLLSACGSTNTAAPAPTGPTTATTAPTTSTEAVAPAPAEEAKLPPLPQVAEANETIVKEAPPPPPPPPAPAGVPCDAGVDACIDLSANQSWLLKDGVVTYGPVPITHGRPGWETPPGTFSVGWKDIDHKSSVFNNAPMPFSVFFNGGIAFHQGSLSQESHGCIHLSWAAAEAYYNALAVGDKVQVVT
ncbi:L,D-transpeptidase [Actinophytocola sp.]|uniref:L,D-transpeptidase n=1 Tax=Actinophytocola sp. TaxID=1872138 RepID=UPI002ED36574